MLSRNKILHKYNNVLLENDKSNFDQTKRFKYKTYFSKWSFQNEYMFSLVQSTNFALQNNQVIQKIKVQHDK